MYSPLLPACCELEAGMIYPGAQPETATFRDTQKVISLREIVTFTTYIFTVHTDKKYTKRMAVHM